MQAGIFVKQSPCIAENAIHSGVCLGFEISEGVVNPVIGNGCLIRAGIVACQVTHGIQVVGKRPQNILRPTVVDRLVGEDLIDRLPPEIAMREVAGRQVARARLVELEGDLVVVVM